jgi:hypothetical protein
MSFNTRAYRRIRHNLLDYNISEFLAEIQPEFQDLPIAVQKLTFLKIVGRYRLGFSLRVSGIAINKMVY